MDILFILYYIYIFDMIIVETSFMLILPFRYTLQWLVTWIPSQYRSRSNPNENQLIEQAAFFIQIWNFCIHRMAAQKVLKDVDMVRGDLVGVEAVLQLAIHLRYGLQRHMKSQFKRESSLSIRKNPNSTQIRKNWSTINHPRTLRQNLGTWRNIGVQPLYLSHNKFGE